MSNAIHVQTRVLPGQRVELTSPDLREGDTVDVFVVARGPTPEQRQSFVEFLRSLPNRKTPEEWEQFERDFQAERDSWDR